MMKVQVHIVVDTDNPTEATDGLNEGFYQLAHDHGFVVDWSYNQNGFQVEPIAIAKSDYVEGQAFGVSA